MEKELVEIVSQYDNEGYLVKLAINEVPIFIPKQVVPMVQIFTPDIEWITEKRFMTKKEFELKFPHLITK